MNLQNVFDRSLFRNSPHRVSHHWHSQQLILIKKGSSFLLWQLNCKCLLEVKANIFDKTLWETLHYSCRCCICPVDQGLHFSKIQVCKLGAQFVSELYDNSPEYRVLFYS